MKKHVFNIVSAALLVCFVASNSFAEVKKIIDEKDILKITGKYSATPLGLAKTSRGTFIFFEKAVSSVMEYDPANKQFAIIANEKSLGLAIGSSRKKQEDPNQQAHDIFKRPSIQCFDLEVDSADNIYAIITEKTTITKKATHGRAAKDRTIEKNDTYALQMIRQGDKYKSPEKITKISDKDLSACELEVDQARKQLIILMDTYKGVDDPNFNGIYTLGIAGNTDGLKSFKSFGQIGQITIPMLSAGDKPIGGTGLAVEGDYLYWHLTIGPANGNQADGDLIMINLATGKTEVALDRQRLINDIGPEGLGQDGNFYFTTFGIDGHDLFMMVNVGIGDRTQNVHQYYVDGNEFEYKGVAAYAEEILQAGDQLGTPLLFYSTECEAKNGKFYIFSGGNLVENLLEITPDYSDPAVVRVAVYSGPGGDGASVFNALSSHRDLYVQKVSPKEIRDGILKNFDVIVQPGGSGSGQGKALQPEGCKAIKDFVRAGHGYIGICAGSYLASSGYEWSLGIINSISVEQAHWARGSCNLEVDLTSEGRRLISDIPSTVSIRYAQGSIYAPAGRTDLPPYRVLAYYRESVTELNNIHASVNGAVEGFMNGMPAITVAEYGKGRVAAVSPHPETKGSGIEYFIHHLARWTAKARPCNRADMIDKPQQDGVKYVQRNYQKPANQKAADVCK